MSESSGAADFKIAALPLSPRGLLVAHRVDKTLKFAVVGFPFSGLGLPGVVHVDELLLDFALSDLLARFAALRRRAADDDRKPHGFTVRVIGVFFLPVVHSAHLLPCCFHALVDVVDQRIVLVRATFASGVLGFTPKLLIPFSFDQVAGHSTLLARCRLVGETKSDPALAGLTLKKGAVLFGLNQRPFTNIFAWSPDALAAIFRLTDHFKGDVIVFWCAKENGRVPRFFAVASSFKGRRFEVNRLKLVVVVAPLIRLNPSLGLGPLFGNFAASIDFFFAVRAACDFGPAGSACLERWAFVKHRWVSGLKDFVRLALWHCSHEFIRRHFSIFRFVGHQGSS